MMCEISAPTRKGGSSPPLTDAQILAKSLPRINNSPRRPLVRLVLIFNNLIRCAVPVVCVCRRRRFEYNVDEDICDFVSRQRLLGHERQHLI